MRGYRKQKSIAYVYNPYISNSYDYNEDSSLHAARTTLPC